MKDMFPLNKDYQQNTRNNEKYEVTFATKGRLQKSAIPYMQRLLNANVWTGWNTEDILASMPFKHKRQQPITYDYIVC